MNPLFFADWGKIHTIFCVIMWLLALVLAVVILGHLLPSQPVAHPHSSMIR